MTMKRNWVWPACVLASVLALAAGQLEAAEAHGHAPHWGYSGKGSAAHWGDLQQDYATCKLGREQSPIDIKGDMSKGTARMTLDYANSPAEVVNNGHTIQLDLASGGTLKLPSGTFKLLQFHFHAPSEEKIDGKSFPLVAHLVHRNDAGQLAVVAVLFKVGRVNSTLARVFMDLPRKEGEKRSLPGGINVAGLLPASRTYYSFKGSLTTPPCSESVQWQVFKEPVELSSAQLAAFRKLYPMNARPVQPRNDRPIEEAQ
jgi:carbonic anhydrase